MSYIRSVSNPEGLYVFGSGDDRLEWIASKNNFFVTCKLSEFKEFVKKVLAEENEEKVTYKNFSYEFKTTENGNFKVFLSINDHEIEMYEVTWAYIVNKIEKEYKTEEIDKANSILEKLEYSEAKIFEDDLRSMLEDYGAERIVNFILEWQYEIGYTDCMKEMDEE